MNPYTQEHFTEGVTQANDSIINQDKDDMVKYSPLYDFQSFPRWTLSSS